MSEQKSSVWKSVLAAMAVAPILALAQPACHEPTANEFRAVTLVDVHKGLEEHGGAGYGPVQMAIAPDGRVFIAMITSGKILMYSPTTANPTDVTLLGTVQTRWSSEDGFMGIALDPRFATNHWLYAFYSDPCGINCPNRAMELGRYTVTNNQLTAKKVILRFPRATDDDHHAGGGMAFDDNGVLVIGTGDNTFPPDPTNAGYGPINTGRTAADAQRTSSNSNDLRGKILRIKPLDFADDATPTVGIGTTYDIPPGNLWEKIQNKSFNPGWDAADDISLVRKEIFTMGNRNPYHPRVDTRTGWIFWGEVGPDADEDNASRGPAGHDEWNLATGPGFFGHPYCNGYNVPYNMMTNASPATYGEKYNCAATLNNSPNNTGIHHLPPAVPALVAYTSGNSTDDDPRFNAGTGMTTVQHAGESAIGGPMYRYDPNLNSPIKFPPFFEGKVLFFDWLRLNFRWITLNPDGSIPAGAAGVKNFTVPGLPPVSYIDLQYGPDGAAYLLKFSDRGFALGTGPALYRVEYTGVQDVACFKPFVATVGPLAVNAKPILHRNIAPGFANGFFSLPIGYGSLSLYDAAGREGWSFRREASDREGTVRLPPQLEHGLWHAKVSP